MKWSFAVAFAVVAASGAASFAQDAWPTKSVSVLVPFAAGGNTDVLARIFAERLSARLGQQFVIENRAGAGGTTGVVAMTKAAADGYTLGVATTAGLASNAVIMKDKLGYNTERDIAYLYNMATQPNLLVAHPSVPAKTLPELAAWLKANPKTPYATSGIGSSQHICGEMLAQQAGVEMSAVAYRASNLQMQDLIAGHIKLACDNFATAWEQVKAGNARAIAVGSPKRYSFSPDVPTFAETFPGFECSPRSVGSARPISTRPSSPRLSPNCRRSARSRRSRRGWRCSALSQAGLAARISPPTCVVSASALCRSSRKQASRCRSSAAPGRRDWLSGHDPVSISLSIRSMNRATPA